MFTQTHLLISGSFFARPGNTSVTAAGLAGALVPDCDVWVMFVVERVQGATGCEVFHYRYLEQPWTTLQSILNSIPLYIGLLIVAGMGIRAGFGVLGRYSGLVAFFALSALLHVFADFLLHHDDARAQWLPFSDVVFRAPVSYWDPDHYGRVFAVVEIALAVILIVLIGRRYARRSIWIGLCLLMLGYSGSVAASFTDLVSHERGPGSCVSSVAEIQKNRAANGASAHLAKGMKQMGSAGGKASNVPQPG